MLSLMPEGKEKRTSDGVVSFYKVGGTARTANTKGIGLTFLHLGISRSTRACSCYWFYYYPLPRASSRHCSVAAILANLFKLKHAIMYYRAPY